MTEELVREIHDVLIDLVAHESDSERYKIQIAQLTQKYFCYEDEMVEAIRRVHEVGRCIPRNTLQISCGNHGCSSCHKYVYNTLCKRLNHVIA